MEIGTGKTYVYLLTSFELSRRYRFQKLIIAVPSVAILDRTTRDTCRNFVLSMTTLRPGKGSGSRFSLRVQPNEDGMKQSKDKKEKISSSVYQIKVSLREITPPIWRRVQVPGNITLAKLHLVLQIVMGWTNSHLHRFSIGGVDYAEPDPDGHLNFQSDRRARLNNVVGAKQKFEYEYDFGDSWWHEIGVEKTLQPEPGASHPICVAGERACPPEDCGGVWGYQEFLEAIMNPAHREHEELLAWVGGSFDPEMFDLDAINASLRRLRV